jgi:5-formyltetrahydrofolate cyclo-ligase
MKKQELREKIKSQKLNLFSSDDEKYFSMSAKMVEIVKNFELQKSSNTLALFASKKASFEIHTDGLISDCLKLGKEVYLPRCLTKSHELEYIQITDLNQDIEIGAYSIREPKSELNLKHQDLVFRNLDVVYVPGVAFDVFGNRLGFGSGYYDNFLREIRNIHSEVPVIALAFDFQVVKNEIPHNAKDEKVDYIITNTSILNCQL